MGEGYGGGHLPSPNPFQAHVTGATATTAASRAGMLA